MPTKKPDRRLLPFCRHGGEHVITSSAEQRSSWRCACGRSLLLIPQRGTTWRAMVPRHKISATAEPILHAAPTRGR